MATFKEANQVHVALKMKLSQYYWYNSSSVTFNEDDYTISVFVKYLDNNVKKVVAPVIGGVSVKTHAK